MRAALLISFAILLPGGHPACEWQSSEPVKKLLVASEALSGDACYYAKKFEGRRTANGEVFRHDLFTAAHKDLPLGTVVLVRSRATGSEVILRINDRGPFGGRFVIDLTRAAAEALGVHASADRGVQIEVLRLPN
ncbi:MAG: septal ring lytic transglycosylase RlpA family protein [Thermoanaerobaculia bacterium]|nr:septal ring lytic transglycosylase RlpA family protein [Thermoanaerobaculia bacterium]